MARGKETEPGKMAMKKNGGSDWRQVFAMAAKQKNADLLYSMRNERYQRTFTDELFEHRATPRSVPVSEEQRKCWELLARKGEE